MAEEQLATLFKNLEAKSNDENLQIISKLAKVVPEIRCTGSDFTSMEKIVARRDVASIRFSVSNGDDAVKKLMHLSTVLCVKAEEEPENVNYIYGRMMANFASKHNFKCIGGYLNSILSADMPELMCDEEVADDTSGIKGYATRVLFYLRKLLLGKLQFHFQNQTGSSKAVRERSPRRERTHSGSAGGISNKPCFIMFKHGKCDRDGCDFKHDKPKSLLECKEVIQKFKINVNADECWGRFQK